MPGFFFVIGGQRKAAVNLSEGELRLTEEVPTSAVELRVKEKVRSKFLGLPLPFEVAFHPYSLILFLVFKEIEPSGAGGRRGQGLTQTPLQ